MKTQMRYIFFDNVPTHDGGKAESEAQSQGYLAGHAAPVLRLSEEDDGAEEGHHQREEQRETQQRIVGFRQRSADVHNKHHLEKAEKKHTKNHSYILDGNNECNRWDNVSCRNYKKATCWYHW